MDNNNNEIKFEEVTKNDVIMKNAMSEITRTEVEDDEQLIEKSTGVTSNDKNDDQNVEEKKDDDEKKKKKRKRDDDERKEKAKEDIDDYDVDDGESEDDESEVDYDDLDHINPDFFDISINYDEVHGYPVILPCSGEEFLTKIEAPKVLVAFREALASRDMAVLDDSLENKEFQQILVLLCVNENKDEEYHMLLPFLDKYVTEPFMTETDDFGLLKFSRTYELDETHEAALVSSLVTMMLVYEKANQVDQHAYKVAISIIKMFDAKVWRNHVFQRLYSCLKSNEPSMIMVAAVIITLMAQECSQGNHERLTNAFYVNRIVSVVTRKVPSLAENLPEFIKDRLKKCCDALGDVPFPSKIVSIKAGPAMLKRFARGSAMNQTEKV